MMSTTSTILSIRGAKAALAVFVATRCVLPTPGQSSWAFQPESDAFDSAALVDLRSLNEERAGQSGWVRVDEKGDFVRGDGEPIRFWAVNTDVLREVPYQPRPKPGWGTAPDIDRHARWLSKRGVNLIRLHTHINPDADTQALDDVNAGEVEWIWRSVGAMKKAGVYSMVSPYWANTMESNDSRWGTDWQDGHHGLLFFDTKLQDAYKEWLRRLFTTPSEALDGKTLAEEPALALFQIQNEDSLLFWTVNNLKPGPKRRLGEQFHHWAVAKYESIEAAFEQWGAAYGSGDDLPNGVLGFANIWDLTSDGKAAHGSTRRLDDQMEFWVETMRSFNAEIARFLHEDLDCPVLVNPGNWKTADVVLMEDSERYSQTSGDAIAVNRYFSGVHIGPNNGWAIVPGDRFTNPSVLQEAARSLPISVKQPMGKPMMVTESTWVMPMYTGFEGPMLISAYSSLSGVDAYFWFAAGTEGFVPPRSANGYNDSQEKWLCLTPDIAGQWPAAALAFRKGYIQRGQPAVQEHRSLEALWQRKSPVIAESASFDPNRDSGDLPPDSALAGGIDPLAFLVGPVTVEFGSSESNSSVIEGLDSYIEHTEGGAKVTSATGQILLDTEAHLFTVDSPYIQSMVAYQPAIAELDAVRFENRGPPVSATIVSLDGRPIAFSGKLLVQVGTQARPTGWVDEEAMLDVSGQSVSGRRVVSYGSAPWRLATAALSLRLANPRIESARSLDANGMALADVPLAFEAGTVSFDFPEGSLYVVLEGTPGQSYDDWKGGISWEAPDTDASAGADPDRDELVNLIEYVSDRDPLVSDRSGLDEVRLDQVGGVRTVALTYRRNTLLSGVVDRFEFSRNLKDWDDVAALGTVASDLLVDADPDQDGTAEERQLVIRLGEDVNPAFVRRRATAQ